MSFKLGNFSFIVAMMNVTITLRWRERVGLHVQD